MPPCSVLSTEESFDEPYRFSIETEAGVKSAIVIEVEKRNIDSGDEKSRTSINVSKKSSYSGDGKSRISMDVKEKISDSGDGKSRMSIETTEKSPNSGDGNLRVGFEIKLDLNDGKPRICIEVKDESSNSGQKSGIDVQAKENSSDSDDGQSGISIEVREKSSNTSSKKSDHCEDGNPDGRVLIWAAISGLFCMILWRTREKPDDGNVAFSLFLKAKLKTRKNSTSWSSNSFGKNVRRA